MKISAKYLAESDVELLLTNWVELNAAIMQLPYEAVMQLLTEATYRGVRFDVINRLHQRYNVLRRERELVGLRKGILPWQLDSAL
jgi:hypothetical protein